MEQNSNNEERRKRTRINPSERQPLYSRRPEDGEQGSENNSNEQSQDSSRPYGSENNNRESNSYGNRQGGGGYGNREGGGGYGNRQGGGGYGNRQGGGGYGNRQGGGGYGNRQGGGSYGNRQGGGGYGNREGGGGYGNREGGGGYGNRQGGGGYGNREGGGGYGNREGGGGYGNREGGGGYGNREGGGGYGNREGGGGYGNREGGGGYGNRQGGGGYGNRNHNSNRRNLPTKRPIQEQTLPPEPVYIDTEQSDDLRLNKYIAQSGICARRKADEIIKEGRVRINGELVTEMGVRVGLNDIVTLDGKVIEPVGKLTYILMNKPKNTLTTTEDPKGRKTVIDLVKDATDLRLYPVGRLDRNTTGILLLTNDGELAKKLSHPSHMVKKVYHVVLDRDFAIADFNKIIRGEVELEEGKVLVDDIAYVTESKRELGVQIHIGWNRVIRRTFETLGYKVMDLDRVMFADLTKKNLPRGKYRFLTEAEVITLKHLMQ